VVYTPPDVIEPTEAVQVTPRVGSISGYVAVKVWVAPAARFCSRRLADTVIGVSVMVAEAAFVGSVLL